VAWIALIVGLPLLLAAVMAYIVVKVSISFIHLVFAVGFGLASLRTPRIRLILKP
jgi:hypothetical protein